MAEQLELTIRRSFNHPSLIIHGFLNECASDSDEGVRAISRLMEICHKLDPTRPATFAGNRPLRDRCLDLVDIVAMNVYPGWYGEEEIPAVPAKLDEYGSGSAAATLSYCARAAAASAESGIPVLL